MYKKSEALLLQFWYRKMATALNVLFLMCLNLGIPLTNQGTPLTTNQGRPLNQGTPLNHGSPIFVKLGNGTRINGSYLVETMAFEERTVSQFLGIPFAQAPVGPLRFKAPINLDFEHPDIIDAQRFGPICFQPMIPQSTLEQQWYRQNENFYTQMSENCLNLNIWVPDRPNPDRKLPVLVFIFGNDFLYGSANQQNLNGKLLAAIQNVVVITTNYRLGPFGFLYTNETKTDQSLNETNSTDQSGNETSSTDQSEANAGLLDQLAALKWINRHIAWFGGDPDHVTLIGQGTGGGVSVGLHALSSAGQSSSYFRRLMLTNGVPTQSHLLTNQERAFVNTLKLARKVNCTRDAADSVGSKSRDTLFQEAVQCLRRVEPDVLLEQSRFSDNFVDLPWVPMIDGQLVNGQLTVGNSQFAGVDILLGISPQEIAGAVMDYMDSLANNDENCGRTLYDSENLTQIFQKFFPQSSENEQLIRMVDDLYENRTFDDQSVFIEMVSDAFFFCPFVHFAQKMTANNASVYFYLFSDQTETPKFEESVSNSDPDSDSYMSYPSEIPYLFGKPFTDVETHRSAFNRRTAEAILISLRFMQILGDFARRGNPGIRKDFGDPTISFEWSQYGREQWYHVIMGLYQDKAKAFKQRECRFWNDEFYKRGFGHSA